MKLIKAIIKPFKLDDAKAALGEIGIDDITISEVRGFGRQPGHSELSCGAEHVMEFHPKVKIEVVFSDELMEKVTVALRDSAGTGKIGDGKVFVLAVEEAVRIRTGEKGEEAV